MKDFKETKNFENILAETGYKVVMFYADWCPPCNMLKPIVAEVSKELTNVNFHKINIDEFRPVAVENGVEVFQHLFSRIEMKLVVIKQVKKPNG